jgi:hypothetical protein
MCDLTYPPLDTLKSVADDEWIVDGPTIRFGPPLLAMPFPTRMTIIRIDGRLFVHSPTRLTPTLAAAVTALGSVAWIVGPNRLHYSWIGDWHRAFPAAAVYLAPKITTQAGGRIDYPWHPLADAAGYPWDEEIATIAVVGRYMSEFAFFHRVSRTLVLADLIENFEPDKLGVWMRLLTRVGGAQDPDGQTPRDLRLTFRGHERELRAAAERMIALDPVRVIIAHGRWYERDGTAELRRALRWVLA